MPRKALKRKESPIDPAKLAAQVIQLPGGRQMKLAKRFVYDAHAWGQRRGGERHYRVVNTNTDKNASWPMKNYRRAVQRALELTMDTGAPHGVWNLKTGIYAALVEAPERDRELMGTRIAFQRTPWTLHKPPR